VHEVVTLAELVRSTRPCVVLTGAGVSTESGVPDFRSAGGIWAAYDPAVVASIDGFRRDPERVWEFYGRRLDLLAGVRPNPAHVVLAELERAGLVQAVITQNVDGLHARAGSREVIEVHGSLASAACLECGETVRADELALPLPRCPVCGSVLKPGVVMFGELLPQDALARAVELAAAAGLLLVVGSSLQVWPVAGLPGETLRHGGRVAVVNREPTPYDDVATIVIRADAGPVFEELRLVLLGERPDGVDVHRQPDAGLERLEEL
jgi:NAD-dependent deacetylase